MESRRGRGRSYLMMDHPMKVVSEMGGDMAKVFFATRPPMNGEEIGMRAISMMTG